MSPTDVDVAALERALRAAVAGEVGFSAGDRALYATDSSNFRQLPIGVVHPRTVDDVVAAVAACRAHGAPVLPRGGGTSLAGQTCNVAVVLDFTRHLNRVLEIDPQRRLARVQPGVVLDRLQEAARPHGLIFGPDPATHGRCTLGGMIGNNSCGVHALTNGKTADNVEWLDVLLYDGTRLRVGRTGAEELAAIIAAGGRRGELYAALRDLRDRHLAGIRTRYPDIPRRVSGYNLDALLPEQGFDVAKALVGTEGTCVTVLEAGLRLVPEPAATTLVALGFPDAVAAGSAVPAVLESGPIGLEGFDSRLYESARSRDIDPAAIDLLPDGGAWLLVELAGEDDAAAVGAGRRLVERMGELPEPPAARLLEEAADRRKVWAIRESALGATARDKDGVDHWAGWEDSAVRPEDLGDYLRELLELYDRYGYTGSLYGHFGQACIHTRIDFDLLTADGIAAYRAFLHDAARLVVRYGGSLSGEHGDGQQRAELLPIMYGDELVGAFRDFKTAWDPAGRMNPGKVVDPHRADEHLRLGTALPSPLPMHAGFGYPEDDGSFARAVGRCVGVGACRHETTANGSVMCPSYLVTREEQHSTRGRARLLWELLHGSLREQGWRSEPVREALDLCLACKGCKSDCPVNVDMATYKAEFLHQHYRRRLRPRSHYSMGWLPVAAWAASVAPGLVNALAPLGKRAAGVDPRRALPRFAGQRFVDWFRARPAPPADGRPRVLLWPDTFTNNFAPEVGRAAVAVLEASGAHVVLPPGTLCCGLTWVSTGQLGVARRVLRRTLAALGDELRAGTPIVGLEPSCTAVFRGDAAELIPADPDVARLQAQTFTLAEYLARVAPSWEPPALGDRAALVQTHCHQHAVLGFGADRAVLRDAGVDATVLDSGCCGLAGNFGFEAGHYEVSMAAGERVLLPAVRAAGEDTTVLADGFSCRTQIEQGAGRRALHLAELLAQGLPDRAR